VDRPFLRLTILAAAGLLAGCAATSPHHTAARTAPRTAGGAATTTSTSATTTVSTLPPPASPTGQPLPAGVNTSDPTAVADAMLTAAFTSNTTIDQSPFDAVKRSLVWYTPAAAQQILASAPTGAPGAQWNLWAQHQATTTVSISPPQSESGAPPDQPTHAHRSFIVTVTPQGPSGWTAPPAQYVCFVTIARNGTAPWQITNLQTDPFSSTPSS
jgi:hypothetical protein